MVLDKLRRTRSRDLFEEFKAIALINSWSLRLWICLAKMVCCYDGNLNWAHNNRFERDFCYAAAPQKPLKRSVRFIKIMRICFTLIFIAMVSCALIDQDTHWSFENNIERELSIENADTEDLSQYFRSSLVKKHNINGQWDSKDWHDGVHLIIQSRTDGKYAVIYYARGDLARWTLMRVATFKDGVLTFEKAVKEYTPVTPYTRFYLLKLQNGIRFVSQAECRYHFVKNKNADWDLIEFNALERCNRTSIWPRESRENNIPLESDSNFFLASVLDEHALT